MYIKLNKDHKKYILLQRNEYMSSFQKKIRKSLGRYLFTNIFINFFNSSNIIEEKLNIGFKDEFKSIEKFIPKNANNILDIGCGLGIINVFLNEFYLKKPNFTLIDKDYVEKTIFYGFNKQGEGYNNLKITENFLLTNNLEQKQLEILNANSNFRLNKKYDLVISLFSMGYHYPIDIYLDKLKKCTTKNTIIIFDLALEYNSLEKIKKNFETIKIIKEDANVKQNYIRLCCQGIINKS